jgi:hypothetical protein
LVEVSRRTKEVKKAVATLCGLFIFALCVGISAEAQFPPRGGRSQGADPRIEQAIDFLLQDMDANQDGKISKKEWLAAHERQLKKLDRNGDGFITKDEIRADMEARMAEAQQSRPGRSGPR